MSCVRLGFELAARNIVVDAVLSGEHNFRDVGVIGLGVVVCLQFLFAARIGFLEMYFVVGWCCRVRWCW